MSLVDCTFDRGEQCGEIAYIANLTGDAVRVEAQSPSNQGVWYTIGGFGPHSSFQQGAASFAMPGDTQIRAVRLNAQGDRTDTTVSLGQVLPGVENFFVVPAGAFPL